MATEQRDAAVRVIERSIEAFCARDADSLASMFTTDGRLRDEAWGEVHEGVEAIARAYRNDFEASPDIEAMVVGHFAPVGLTRELGGERLVSELLVRGTHLGTWRGLPGTGARFELRVFAVATFDAAGNRLVENRILYDRASILQQLGVMHDLTKPLGRTLTMLTHPVTMARAAQRRLSARPASPHA